MPSVSVPDDIWNSFSSDQLAQRSQAMLDGLKQKFTDAMTPSAPSAATLAPSTGLPSLDALMSPFASQARSLGASAVSGQMPDDSSPSPDDSSPPYTPTASSPATSGLPSFQSLPALGSLVASAMPSMSSAAPSTAPSRQPALTTGPTPSAAPLTIDHSSPQAFLGGLSTAATAALQRHNLPTSLAPILAAIPMNEQGWQKDAPGQNYYGIKGSNPRTGANTGPVGTWEDYGAGRQNIQDTFRAYDDPSESVDDFLSFLESNPRYSKALDVARQTGDPAGFIRAVHAAGYATDPAWSDKILSISKTVPQTPAARQPALTTGPTPTAAQPSSGGLDADGIVKAYSGTSYTYGGPGGRTAGFGAPTDCSGFVSAIYQNQYGLDLVPHTDGAYNQLRQLGAPEVKTQDARPGDVVFYMGAGTGGAITHHMGVYAGDGKVLDDSVSGQDGVHVRDVGHAGQYVILRDPRLNTQTPQSASAPPPIQPSGLAEQTGGAKVNQQQLAQAATSQPGGPPWTTAQDSGTGTTALRVPLSTTTSSSPTAQTFSSSDPGGLMLRQPMSMTTMSQDQAPTWQDDQTQSGYVTPDMAPGPPIPDMSGTASQAPAQPAPFSPPDQRSTGYGQDALNLASSVNSNVLAPIGEALDRAREWTINNPVTGSINPTAWGRELGGWDQISQEVGPDTVRLQELMRRYREGDTSVLPEAQALSASLNERTAGVSTRAGLLAKGAENPNKTAETLGDVVTAGATQLLAPNVGAGISRAGTPTENAVALARNAASIALDPKNAGIQGIIEAPGHALGLAREAVSGIGSRLDTYGGRAASALDDTRAAPAADLANLFTPDPAEHGQMVSPLKKVAGVEPPELPPADAPRFTEAARQLATTGQADPSLPVEWHPVGVTIDNGNVYDGDHVVQLPYFRTENGDHIPLPWSGMGGMGTPGSSAYSEAVANAGGRKGSPFGRWRSASGDLHPFDSPQEILFMADLDRQKAQGQIADWWRGETGRSPELEQIPYQSTNRDKGGVRVYKPDFFVQYPNGNTQVWEAKPAKVIASQEEYGIKAGQVSGKMGWDVTKKAAGIISYLADRGVAYRLKLPRDSSAILKRFSEEGGASTIKDWSTLPGIDPRDLPSLSKKSVSPEAASPGNRVADIINATSDEAVALSARLRAQGVPDTERLQQLTRLVRDRLLPTADDLGRFEGQTRNMTSRVRADLPGWVGHRGPLTLDGLAEYAPDEVAILRDAQQHGAQIGDIRVQQGHGPDGRPTLHVDVHGDPQAAQRAAAQLGERTDNSGGFWYQDAKGPTTAHELHLPDGGLSAPEADRLASALSAGSPSSPRVVPWYNSEGQVGGLHVVGQALDGTTLPPADVQKYSQRVEQTLQAAGVRVDASHPPIPIEVSSFAGERGHPSSHPDAIERSEQLLGIRPVPRPERATDGAGSTGGAGSPRAARRGRAAQPAPAAAGNGPDLAGAAPPLDRPGGVASAAALRAAPGRALVGGTGGAIAGGTAGYQSSPEDASPLERTARTIGGAVGGGVAGATVLGGGTLAAGRLIDSLVERGAINPRVLASHPGTAERIRALFSLAAEGLPDHAVVEPPAMARAIVQLRPKVGEQVADLLGGPVTAGQVRQIVGAADSPSVVQTVSEMVTDALTGLGGRARRGRELAADRATVRGLSEEAKQATSGRLAESAAVLDSPSGPARRVDAQSAPNLTAFVNEVADRLGVARPGVYVSRAGTVNASATVDGRMPALIVTRGLLEAGLSDDEMAAVLTHELAHTAQDPRSLVGRAFGAVSDAITGGGRALAGAVPADRQTIAELARQAAASRDPAERRALREEIARLREGQPDAGVTPPGDPGVGDSGPNIPPRGAGAAAPLMHDLRSSGQLPMEQVPPDPLQVGPGMPGRAPRGPSASAQQPVMSETRRSGQLPMEGLPTNPLDVGPGMPGRAPRGPNAASAQPVMDDFRTSGQMPMEGLPTNPLDRGPGMPDAATTGPSEAQPVAGPLRRSGQLPMEGLPSDPMQQGMSGSAPPGATPGAPSGTQTMEEGLPGLLAALSEHGPRARAERAAQQAQAALPEPGAQPVGRLQSILGKVGDAIGGTYRRSKTVRMAGMLSDTAGRALDIFSNTVGQAGDIATGAAAVPIDMARVAALRAAGRPAERVAFAGETPRRLAGMRAGWHAGWGDLMDAVRGGLSESEKAKVEGSGFDAAGIPGLSHLPSSVTSGIDLSVEAPLRLLAGADALFRSTATGGHLMAESYAAAKAANGGAEPTSQMIRQAANDPAVLKRVQDLSKRSVLQEDRNVTDAYRAGTNRLHGFPRAILQTEIPFLRTPWNIMAQGAEMTPLGAIGALNDFAHGRSREGVTKLARSAIGTSLMGVSMNDYANGNLTGPRPTDQKEISTLPPGWQPWSRKVTVGGQTYYLPLAALGPYALPSVAAILAVEARKKGTGPGDVAARMAAGVGQYASQNSFLQGFDSMYQTLQNPDRMVENHIEQIAASYSPHVIGGGALGRELQRIMGMPTRDPHGAWQAIEATLPYAAGKVAPSQDVLGRPKVPYAPGPIGAVARIGQQRDVDVIRAFRQAKQGLPLAPPKQVTDPGSKEDVPLTVPQQKQWQRDFGAALRDGYDQYGSPDDAATLAKIEAQAREAANQTALGLR